MYMAIGNLLATTEICPSIGLTRKTNGLKRPTRTVAALDKQKKVDLFGPWMGTKSLKVLPALVLKTTSYLHVTYFSFALNCDFL